ncbi:putative nuclease HARBI1 [Anoplophora glabripennis]|uniref:putative nuclease HARBI1 n=1 Tax=Anoplophora glabripennis TaxID=217634 RepID=UPI0008735711|nr:putative nuclease HARBI1 [Anoplophora glabripennis]
MNQILASANAIGDELEIEGPSPGGEEAEIYRNRKGYFSFNVQAICDSKLIIKDIVDDQVRHQMLQFLIIQGCEEIWNFKGSLLLGDAGYPIKNYLMTPLQDPRTPAEALYNEAQIRTRNPIERCFGVWKRRFPILALGIKLHIDKVEEIVIASAVIHNVAIHMRDELSYVNEEIEAAIQIGNVNEVANQLKNCYLKIYCKVQ